jgi:hypothetical protein
MGRFIVTLFSAVPALWIGWTLYGALHDPLGEGNRTWAVNAPVLMMMEFLLVHAGVVTMGVLFVRELRMLLLAIAALAAFYAVFFAAFWNMTGGSHVVLAAGVLLMGRLVDTLGLGWRSVLARSSRPSWRVSFEQAMLSGGAAGTASTSTASDSTVPRHAASLFNPAILERTIVSVTGVLLFLIGIFASLIPDPFPQFGFTPAVLAELRPASGMSGPWFDEPQRVVAFAAGYFATTGVLDLVRGAFMARRSRG